MNSQHVDVVIVGAGLSGVGAAVHLKKRCPDRTFVLLEGRESLGGTWDLFRYPGIRSDSDMLTLGYSFKPWLDKKAIADGPSILRYIRETAEEYRIDQCIRYQKKVTKAAWCSQKALWTVSVTDGATGESESMTCHVLHMCAGYYSYRGGYTPEFPGRDRFEGLVIHPQAWPEHLDYTGKRVVVIGSGATAITLVPAMADQAKHVTMLQRSPTYVVSWAEEDGFANVLRKVLPAKIAYGLARFKNVFVQQYLYGLTQRYPERSKSVLIDKVRKEVGADFDVERHFTPSYKPWQQRICLTPNGDIFDALKNGSATVVTDTIKTFTESGIELESGEEIATDIIVTATGLKLAAFGEVRFSVDGQDIDFSKAWTYKGLAVSGVPNLFSCFGYVNASWTLRADLIATFVCRVLNHMKETGMRQCTPVLREEDKGMEAKPWVDGFNPGYFARASNIFPRQGPHAPWINPQNYANDKRMMLKDPLEDGVLSFTSPSKVLAPVA